MKPVRYALHAISDPDRLGFRASEYSAFKFGDYAAAKKFGESLAHGFIAVHGTALQRAGQIVVLSSPYSFIPTASFAMKIHFTAKLNRWLAGSGLPVAQEARVHRSSTYREDYGELDAAQRLALISGDSFYIDREFLTGKTLLFIDDIRITGSHERMISRMIADFRLEGCIYMLYFAELKNQAIHPSFENELNYMKVKCIFDLQQIVDSPGFFINTRVVKYILGSDSENFSIFMKSQQAQFLNLLYDMALGNSYHAMPCYQQNLGILATFIQLHEEQRQKQWL